MVCVQHSQREKHGLSKTSTVFISCATVRRENTGGKKGAEGTTKLTASRLNSLNMFLIPGRSVTGCDIINGGGSLRGITG